MLAVKKSVIESELQYDQSNTYLVNVSSNMFLNTAARDVKRMSMVLSRCYANGVTS